MGSELIRTQHDLKLSMELQSILETKVNELKIDLREEETRNSKQKEEISSLNKIVGLQK